MLGEDTLDGHTRSGTGLSEPTGPSRGRAEGSNTSPALPLGSRARRGYSPLRAQSYPGSLCAPPPRAWLLGLSQALKGQKAPNS